jgi:threonine synthase
MYYFSTNHTSEKTDFRQATINGQAPDKGLYFPESIQQLSQGLLQNLKKMSREEIALEVIRPYVGESIPPDVLEKIVSETINFDFPLVPVTERISALELYHGPTLAFKDVGARFMSRCLGYFVRDMTQRITVLVATSGDTGGAVASGFYDVEGVEVVILYPSGKVSSVQEQQLTTLGKNIRALEIEGSFDDCQAMVKQAFMDPQLKEKKFLTSANSINVARWLPQQFYYFFAAQQWEDDQPPVVSVPSGNFGNICAGLLAYCSGLPVKHFIAACNANDVVPNYFESGSYQAKKAVATISNAMDVGDPSNFVRILELFGKELTSLSPVMSSCSISDKETIAVIQEVYREHQYLLDPHGAVGFLGLQRYLDKNPQSRGYFLETAHPVKFYDVVEPALGQEIPVPGPVRLLSGKKKIAVRMDADPDQLKSFLLDS